MNFVLVGFTPRAFLNVFNRDDSKFNETGACATQSPPAATRDGLKVFVANHHCKTLAHVSSEQGKVQAQLCGFHLW